VAIPYSVTPNRIVRSPHIEGAFTVCCDVVSASPGSSDQERNGGTDQSEGAHGDEDPSWEAATV